MWIITGAGWIGGLVGQALSSTTVDNCYTTGTVTGSANYTGGLVGENVTSSTVSNCYSTASVSGTNYVGGLVGDNYDSSIVSNSYSTGTVSGDNICGGLLGYQFQAAVNNCYTTGTVIGDSECGGLVGRNRTSSTVSNCYSRGDVTRESGSSATNFGSFCGNNYASGTIENCYSTGSVTYVGATNPTDKGFVGDETTPTTYSDNFFDSNTSNQTTGTGATAKTTTEMTTDALVYNYTTNIYLNGGWDFKGETTNGTDNIWNIGNSRNDGYPYFDWEYPDDPATLPIVLSTFTVQFIENTPTLYWTTQSETDNIGWNVYRNTEEDFSSAQVITNELIPGNGTTTEPSYYNFADNSQALEIGTTYWYWLENVDLGGETHYSYSVSITIPTQDEEPSNIEPPVVYILNTAPNPMNSSTYFCFTLDKSVEATISIYNIKGELVRTLPKVWADADAKTTVYWNGKDENGNTVKDGIYFYQLNVDGKPYKTNKLIVIR